LPVVEVRAVEPDMRVLIELGDGDGREAGISRHVVSSACEINVHAFLFGAASGSRLTRCKIKD
jgi:hypothetical protein